MHKTPTRTKSAIIMGAENSMFKKWSAVISLIDGYSSYMQECVLKHIKKLTIDKIYKTIQEDSRLASFDEKIFEYYQNLIELYQEVSVLLKSEIDKINDKETKNIAYGIYSVLVSRIRIYTEMFMISDERISHVENPIHIEKKDIVLRGMKAFASNYEHLVHRYKLERTRETIYKARRHYFTQMTARDANEALAEIFTDVKKYCYVDLYSDSVNILKAILFTLNDLEQRKATSKIETALFSEHQILSALIKVQLGTLEQYITQNTTIDTSGINTILNKLRESYQYLGKEISDILSNYQEIKERNRVTNVTFEFSSFEEFVAEVGGSDIDNVIGLSSVDFVTRALSYRELINELDGELSLELKEIFDARLVKYSTEKEIIELQKRNENAVLLCEDLLYIFRRIDEYNQSIDFIDNPDIEIIKGIKETIEIKIDSIEESKTDYADESKSFFDKISKETVNISNEQLREQTVSYRNHIFNELATLGKDDRRAVSGIKRIISETASSDFITGISEQAEKLIQKHADELNKKILNYYKNRLLYEIGTFEEIITYSVSRLRESQNEDSQEYARFIDDKSNKIDRILTQRGIEMINPSEKEMFNGKEHEVLIAEKTDGFNKGEIIKVMNKGYKIGGQIILRANVIAAK